MLASIPTMELYARFGNLISFNIHCKDSQGLGACVGVSESRSDQSGKATSGLDHRSYYELTIVMLVTVSFSVLLYEEKGLAMFIPVAYLLFERGRKRRRWSEFGLNREGYLRMVRANWHLIVLVAFIIQFVVIVGASLYIPAFMDHIYSRIPWTPDAGIGALFGFLGLILFVTFMEELVDRGLIQGRFTGGFGPLIGIVIASLFMAAMHWAPGAPFIVFLDLLAVFIDSLIFGLIYFRTRSIFVSWTAHLGVDLFDIVLMLLV
jgi:membrane protease YdiL (CAAX protease family)